MGYAHNLFLKPAQIKKQFICGVCKEVVQAPVILHPCDHAVCTACAEGRKTCPVDRRRVESTKELQRPLLELLNELQLWCPHSSSGCTAVVLLGNLPTHELECEYNPGNYEECGGGCRAIIKINRRRKTGQDVHNCVDFINGNLVATERELDVTKAQLVDKEKELKDLRAMKMVFEENEKELRVTKKELSRCRRELEQLELKNKNGEPSKSKKHRHNSDYSDPEIICTRRWGFDDFDLSTQNRNESIIEGVQHVVKIYSIVLGNNLPTNPQYHKTELFIKRTANQLSKCLEAVGAKATLTSFKWEAKVDQPQSSQAANQWNQDQDRDPQPRGVIGLEFDVNLGDRYWVQILLSSVAD